MKCGRPRWMLRQLFQAFFLTVLSILIVGALLAYLFYFLPTYTSFTASHPGSYKQISRKKLKGGESGLDTGRHFLSPVQLIPLAKAGIRHVSKKTSSGAPGRDEYRPKCSMFSCFDIHKCGGGVIDPFNPTNGSMSVYVYPIYNWVVDGIPLQTSLSYEFYQFLKAIKESPNYVADPKEACIFVPSIDLFNLNRLKVSTEDLLAVLSSHEYWGESGQNHVLLTLFPGNSPLLQLKTDAVIASTGLYVDKYRLGFHIPLISPSPRDPSMNSLESHNKTRLDLHSVSAQGGLGFNIEIASSKAWIGVAVGKWSTFEDLITSGGLEDSVLFLDYCNDDKSVYRPLNIRCSYGNSVSTPEKFPYPRILGKFEFCLVIRDLASPVLWEMMSVGCIPVIIADHQRLPFDEVIDWRQNAIHLYEHQINRLSSILASVSKARRKFLKEKVLSTFNSYFKDLKTITNTILMTLQDRVLTHYMRNYQEWNGGAGGNILSNPLFNPVVVSKDSGFTAVILAYERVASLFTVIQRVSQVQSLAKILVIWNNQQKEPPSLESWPDVGVPVKIIKTAENRMSNRFFPYDEIETEAVFSVDDDIVMLTADEIEFGFETWREFPDRIVGFPSRSHVWDNTTQRWKYESEWKSEISMVLTGAAFYHQYWHHAYTTEFPRQIREWVDAKMNCEDIAMNFLVSARTGKPPIKVTPRKKFKCPTCNNAEMLSTDSGHMVERTECINKFAQIMGIMPLISAEFRADPVLFKVDEMNNRLKSFPDMGSM